MSEFSNVLPSGFLLQEYRIETVLGSGGFGITYKAWDTHLNTWVAIKEYFPAEWCYRGHSGVSVLSNTLSAKGGADEGHVFDYEWGLNRFLDEARVLARVQSPYVVRIKRYFRANGSAYIVMDYEEGEPLNRRLKRVKVLSESEIMGFLGEVLPALRSVHEQGFLHRDIKPSNLYIRTRDGCIMLLDFGAAREAIGRVSRSITGLVTPGYSPPEQYAIRSDRYGGWSDIYALGAVLYRCIAGKPPLEAAERMLEDRMVPAREAGAGRYSPALLAAIDKALAIRPEARYQSVLDMQLDMGLLDADGANEDGDTRAVPSLAGEKETLTRMASPTSPSRRNRWPWWLGAPLSLALVATVWVLSTREKLAPMDDETGLPVPLRESTPVVLPPDSSPDPAPSAEAAARPGPTRARVAENSPTAVVPERESAGGGEDYLESRIDMPMAWVPGGCFSMGSPAEEIGRYPNETRHRRCVEGFWLSRHEVSNAQFRQFREAHDSGAYRSQSFDGDNQPVVEVNWHDAVAFSDWLSAQTGKRYRLPDEAEWEYAARADTSASRFWGNAPDEACSYANIHDLTSRETNPELVEVFDWQDFHDCHDSAAVTTVVGSYRPNSWGLYDMLGNVWEWTCSAYREDHSDSDLGCHQDEGPKVLRGGGWVSTPDSIRSARRLAYDSTEALDAIGFRLLREGEGTK